MSNNINIDNSVEVDIEKLPIIDLSLLKCEIGKIKIANEIHKACKEHGFFYIKNHGISKKTTDGIIGMSKRFFSLPLETKMNYKMGCTNREYLGFFKDGQEITQSQIDHKEGMYVDCEMEGDIKPEIGIPLYPTPEDELKLDIVGFKSTVENYLKEMTELGHLVIEAIAISLGLPNDYFYEKYTKEPFILMGCLHSPSNPVEDPDESSLNGNQKWSTNSHTDWGFLTLLLLDEVGGLQVQSKSGDGSYIDAPPIPGTFVVNIGDMFDKITGGYYLSNVHRVKFNQTGKSRYSFPFFLDPNLNSVPTIIPGMDGEKPKRWDERNIHDFSGSYLDYFMSKIGRVFPEYVYKK